MVDHGSHAYISFKLSKYTTEIKKKKNNDKIILKLQKNYDL